jgi:hypothetical protein
MRRGSPRPLHNAAQRRDGAAALAGVRAERIPLLSARVWTDRSCPTVRSATAADDRMTSHLYFHAP